MQRSVFAAAKQTSSFHQVHVDRHPRFAERIYGTCRRQCRVISGLMLAARITLPHFSVSSAISFPKSAGESASAAPPRSASRALIKDGARA